MTREIAASSFDTTQRDLGPDLARGAAILLLILTNVPLITTTLNYSQAVGADQFTGHIPEDLAMLSFIAIAPMTGMGLFVLSMGYGLQNAVRSRRAYRLVQVRLVVLGSLGLIHGLCIWWGDILFYYMIAGSIALYFRNRSVEQQLIIGSCAIALPLLPTMAELLVKLQGVSETAQKEIHALTTHFLAGQHQAIHAYTSKDMATVLQQRLEDWFGYAQLFSPVGLPQLVGLFLIGIAMARVRLKTGALKVPDRRVKVVPVIAVIITCGYLYQLAIQIRDPAGSGISGSIAAICQISCPPLLAILLYYLAVRFESRLSRHIWARGVAVTGRYALTIYLMTSIIFTGYAYGLGRFNTDPISLVQLFALTAFCAMVGFSLVLARYQLRGPFEWALRRVTSSAPRSPSHISPR